ncbi:MAG: pyridoxamine 5'-phosphate oxidase family protein [Candidatus Limnocylindrales bacterium]
MTATLDPTTPAGARALERLASEKIGWLTTVDPDGQPYASAIWFLWDAGEILVYSGKRAPRNGNLETNRRVAFNLHTDAGGGDYVSMEGTARIDPDGAPVSSQNAPYLAKYQSMIEGYGWDNAYFDREYPVAIRITPTRWRVG